MHLKTRNVNTAFRELVQFFKDGQDGKTEAFSRGINPIVRRDSRNGPVMMIDEPVTITYSQPRERVLFNSARDANPFMHLYEAMWMLAGRNDVAPLAYYTKQFLQYSDNGWILNGAYGYRWRHANDGHYPITSPMENDGYRCGGGHEKKVDQLDLLVAHLKANPDSRRAVLQMWTVEEDLDKIDSSKDVCCNLSVMFSIRTLDPSPSGPRDEDPIPRRVLDMTVTNRSNDLVWGLLGANYVHFTFLQEYMAARIGVEVGVYNHFTNNLHAYESNWKPEEWLADEDPYFNYGYDGAPEFDHVMEASSVPLIRDPAVFERELPEFVERFSGKLTPEHLGHDWEEPFLANVAAPLLIGFACHKAKDDHSALCVIAECEADDWRIAAEGWIRRRLKNP